MHFVARSTHPLPSHLMSFSPTPPCLQIALRPALCPRFCLHHLHLSRVRRNDGRLIAIDEECYPLLKLFFCLFFQPPHPGCSRNRLVTLLLQFPQHCRAATSEPPQRLRDGWRRYPKLSKPNRRLPLAPSYPLSPAPLL